MCFIKYNLGNHFKQLIYETLEVALTVYKGAMQAAKRKRESTFLKCGTSYNPQLWSA